MLACTLGGANRDNQETVAWEKQQNAWEGPQALYRSWLVLSPHVGRGPPFIRAIPSAVHVIHCILTNIIQVIFWGELEKLTN
jgi:hypothetical protein